MIFKVIPDETTRLAALKGGEVDIVYSVRGELAEELRRTPGLTLKPAVVQGVFCLYFPDQWDPKSPWHDQRVRQAANLAIDRKSSNEALTLGYSLITGNPIVPDHYEFWKPPPRSRSRAAESSPSRASRRLTPANITATVLRQYGEAVSTTFGEAGIRCKLWPIERAAFIKGYTEKKFKN